MRALVLLVLMTGCTCGPMPSMAPDASVPILSVYECQRSCLEKRDAIRRDFAVNLDCSKFPLFVATCSECSQHFVAQSGITLVCD